jgi:hypothetical protein
MADLNQDQMANAVASGKHRYEMDKVIGWQVVLGVLALLTGQFYTIPLGAGLLALTVYIRNKA